MKFLIDAQLPRQMVGWFAAAGCNAGHTLELPLGNRTPDKDITDFANRDQRVLVTKDGDFVDSHLLSGQPAKLLLVTTGNISNRALEHLTVPLIPVSRQSFNSIHFWNWGNPESSSAVND
jgi:predicted nuclease of predicted toxin-antitoxin system